MSFEKIYTLILESTNTLTYFLIAILFLVFVSFFLNIRAILEIQKAKQEIKTVLDKISKEN